MKTTPIKSLLAFFLLGFYSSVFAQPGTIDLTFNPNDGGFAQGDGVNNAIYATSIQADGKILVGGAFTTINGTPINRVARLHSDGTLDNTFNPGTGVDNGLILAMALQSDGKILIAGTFSSFNGTQLNRIARLNPSGTLDNSFNSGTGPNSSVNSVVLLPDGKIMIGGAFTTVSGNSVGRIARLNADGSFDSSFSPVSGANFDIHRLHRQTDGKILVVGSFSEYDGSSRRLIARINENGTLDNSFNPGSGALPLTGVGHIYAVTEQTDGKILIGGNFTSYNGSAVSRIARLHPNGSLDQSFNPGAGPNNMVRSIKVLADGKILVAGEFENFDNVLVRRIARINDNGSLDNTFSSGVINTVITIDVLANDKILIGGNFTPFHNMSRNRLARLNTDGTLDNSFMPNTASNGNIRAICLQSDGKLLIGGEFTAYDEVAKSRIARINTDGTLDNSFDSSPTAGADNTVRCISTQTDGKIIVGVDFTSFNFGPWNSMARYRNFYLSDASRSICRSY